MKLLSKQEFETLANIQEEHCVTIYIPTHRVGESVLNGKDALNFKNHLQKVRNTLQELGMTESQAREFLDPAYRLHDDANFWHHQLDGLAVFLSKDHFSYYRLPCHLDEFSCVTSSFHLLQMVPLMSGDGVFYILGLSLEKVRLFEATHYYVNELDLEGRVQQGLKEVEKYYEFEKSNENKSGMVPNPQNRNGQGELHPTKKELIEEYFRNVVVGLKTVIVSDRTPVVVAGVEYLHPIFKEAAHGLNVMPKGIHGNPDGLQGKELHSKAWEIVEPHFNRDKERNREAYGNWLGSGKTTSDVNQIVTAAFNGRVDTLFVAKQKHQWGRFNETSQEVELHDNFNYGDVCLVSRSAVQTILNGGNAFVVDVNELPENKKDTKMAAMLRF